MYLPKSYAENATRFLDLRNADEIRGLLTLHFCIRMFPEEHISEQMRSRIEIYDQG